MSDDAGGRKAATLYDVLGGEAAILAFTERFYALMDSLPEAAACRAIHPRDLSGSRQKLFEYLTGWLGGPPLFVERHGPPMLRARHLRTPIGEDEIEGWLACFRLAWAQTLANPEVETVVLPRVEALARHMHNQPR
ncbi:group II truncated hemoglobin [Nostoc sp. NIES-2111]